MNTETSLIAVRRVSLHFGGLMAVNDVSFSIERGGAVGLIGPNGAGKSTLFNIVNGLLSPSSGSIMFNGHDVTKLRTSAVARLGVGRTFQTARPFHGLTVLENLMAGTTSSCRTLPQGRWRAQAVSARAVDMAKEVGLYEVLASPVTRLPYGMLKRLGVGRALMAEPSLLLLDEPFAGIGGSEADAMIQCITRAQRRGVTTLIVEHKLRFLMPLITRVLVMHLGRLIAGGSPAEIERNTLVQTAYLGAKGAQWLVSTK